MENISPTLLLCLKVRQALDSGQSVRIGIMEYIKYSNDDFGFYVQVWLSRIDQKLVDQKVEARDSALKLTSSRKVLLSCLERGLRGVSIQNQLDSLLVEIQKSCEAELDDRISKLPLKLMLPVLFLMFPAYLLLLLGPLLSNMNF